jgi:hypothetical protein
MRRGLYALEVRVPRALGILEAESERPVQRDVREQDQGEQHEEGPFPQHARGREDHGHHQGVDRVVAGGAEAALEDVSSARGETFTMDDAWLKRELRASQNEQARFTPRL